MTIENKIVLENVYFEDYLKIPGHSFSSLKNEGIPTNVTPKMRFGSSVDSYLFTPQLYKGENFKLVKPVANKLHDMFGHVLQVCKPQISVTCDMVHEGLRLKYKGRPDLMMFPQMIIDLKVSELNPVKAVEFFRYDWQLSGYSLALGCKDRIIISIHPKTFKISVIPISLKVDWWNHQVIKHGSIAA